MSDTINLFGEQKWDELKTEKEWELEWRDMPEYVQDDLTSYKSVIIHFKDIDDMRDFAKLVDQRITMNTQSLWYPKPETRSFVDKRYKNES